MKKHKLLSISAVIMMLSVYGCSLDEFNPSGISTEQEWSTPAGYEKKVNDCYFLFIACRGRPFLFCRDAGGIKFIQATAVDRQHHDYG